MTRPPPSPAAPRLTGRSARTIVIVVSLTGSIIATCAFAFSFGNIWHLATLWGLPAPIAPLVAPMLDLSVVGLLIAIRQLILHDIPGRRLLGARLLMLACAVTTWALNITQSVLEQRWGAAVMDSVAPALLLGWAEVGPSLLRLAVVPPQADQHRPVRWRDGGTTTSTGPCSLAPPPEVPRVVPASEEPGTEDDDRAAA